MSAHTVEAVASIAARLADTDSSLAFVVAGVASMMLIAARLVSAARRAED